METPGSEAAVTMLGRGEEGDGFYDLEHLPPLLEDEVRHETNILHGGLLQMRLLLLFVFIRRNSDSI